MQFPVCTRRPAVLVLLATALPLLVAACKKSPIGHPPATPSQPMGISNGGYNTTYEFRATTTDPDSDSVAVRFSWGDGATSDWSNWVASGETATMSHAWPNAGTYQVKAQAKDMPGLTSDWSASLPATIIATHPPNTPGAPTGPSSARKDSLCTFTTIATDPDGDGVSYRFVWNQGDTSEWTDWVPSGQPGSKKYAFRRAGAYQVRAQARDVNEALSAWSNPLQVAVANPYPPTTPATPTGPAWGEVGATLSYSTTASDSGGDSISVRFTWGDGDTSGWSGLAPSGDTSTLSHVWPDFGVYMVRAQARDEDDALSGWSKAETVSITPFLKWRYQTGDDVCSSPAFGSDGTIYFGSFIGYLYAVNPSGTLKWRYQTGDYINSSPAVGADGTIYVGSSHDYLCALNPDGTLKWRCQASVGCGCSPAVGADGTIYVGAYGSGLLAIGIDGAIKWLHQGGGAVFTSPAIGSDGTIYVGAGDSGLYAINPDSTLKWRCRVGDHWGSRSLAVDSGGTIYVGASYSGLYAINPDGTVKWCCQALLRDYASPVVGPDGTVYVGDVFGVYAIHPDGTLKWHNNNLWGGVSSSPAIASDGTLYVGPYGYLSACGPDGAVRWHYRLSEGKLISVSPAIGPDGTVYIGSADGCLYAFQCSSPLADAPWPKFQHDTKNTGCFAGGR